MRPVAGKEGEGDAIDAGGLCLATGHAFEIAGLAVGFGNAGEEAFAAGEVGDHPARQVHAGIGMQAVQGEPAAAQVLHAPVVGITATPDGHGYWLVGADGGVFAFGDAGYYGSWPSQNPPGSTGPPWPIIALVSSPDGRGYTLATSNGMGGYVYGDYGSCRAGPEGGPDSAVYTAVAAVADQSGAGCWVASVDGGVFTGGSAPFYGSLGGHTLNAPIVGMARTPDGGGYWLAASDGGVFAFGDAAFEGSMGGSALDEPIVGLAAS